MQTPHAIPSGTTVGSEKMKQSHKRLPLLLWLQGDTGRRLLARLAKRCERRGTLLLFCLPLTLALLALQPFFPQEQSWADFGVQMTFFLLGYLLFAQPEFLQLIRRDIGACI